MIPKFRFFDTEENKMHVVDSLYTFKSFGGKDVTIATEDIDVSEWRSYSDGVLMQSTGLKDKKGVDIFEGDIISCEIETIEKFIICEQCGCFGIRDEIDGFISLNSINETLSIHEEFEVIGNIYEHPHLLKE